MISSVGKVAPETISTSSKPDPVSAPVIEQAAISASEAVESTVAKPDDTSQARMREAMVEVDVDSSVERFKSHFSKAVHFDMKGSGEVAMQVVNETTGEVVRTIEHNQSALLAHQLSPEAMTVLLN